MDMIKAKIQGMDYYTRFPCSFLEALDVHLLHYPIPKDIPSEFGGELQVEVGLNDVVASSNQYQTKNMFREQSSDYSNTDPKIKIEKLESSQVYPHFGHVRDSGETRIAVGSYGDRSETAE